MSRWPGKTCGYGLGCAVVWLDGVLGVVGVAVGMGQRAGAKAGGRVGGANVMVR